MKLSISLTQDSKGLITLLKAKINATINALNNSIFRLRDRVQGQRWKMLRTREWLSVAVEGVKDEDEREREREREEICISLLQPVFFARVATIRSFSKEDR